MLLAAVAHADVVTVPGTYPTIQAALDGAPDGAVVEVAPGHYYELLRISANHRLTLRGVPSDPGQVIIDGGGLGDTVRIIGAGDSLVIEGVTITGGSGYDGWGGGLFMAQSSATLRDCVIRNNATARGAGAYILQSAGRFERCTFRDNVADGQGGGALVNQGSTTLFEDCQFVDNRAGRVEPIGGYGGGLSINQSSPTFDGCVIARNIANFAGGGVVVTSPYSEAPSIVTFNQTTISDNVALRVSSTDPPAEGGGIHVEDNTRAILDRCRVERNQAHKGGGLGTYRARYEITDSLIQDNVADADIGDAGHGGGILVQSVNVSPPAGQPGELVLRRSVVRRNRAAFGGAIYAQGDFVLDATRGMLEIEDSIVADNQATTAAGGVMVDRSDATIRRSQITGNAVTAGSFGGGIVTTTGALLVMERSALAGNVAPVHGAGIYADQGGRLEITESHLYGNVLAAGTGFGGGAITIGGTPGPAGGPISGFVVRSTIADNGSEYEIHEANCDMATWSTVIYDDNALHNDGAGFYFRSCSGPSASLGAFEGVAGKASGNEDRAPVFDHFLAAPATIVIGAESVLGWVAPGHGSLAITPAPGGVAGVLGSTDVRPTETTDYELRDARDDELSTARVTVACGILGTPVLRRPTDASGSQDPSGAILEWYATTGALAYDVYLDGTEAPATLVASDVTGTSFATGPLAADAVLHWRVVAKNPLCTEPTTSPAFSFRTCATAGCAYADDFGDRNASDWTLTGKGSAAADSGTLRIEAGRMLTATPPAPWIENGSIELMVTLAGGRNEARLVFGFRDARNLRELVLRASGRLSLEERTNGRRRVVARGRQSLPIGASFPVRIDMQGADVSVTLAGEPSLSGQFSSAGPGGFGVRARRSAVGVDDLRIVGGIESGAGVLPLGDPTQGWTSAGQGRVKVSGARVALQARGRFQTTAPLYVTRPHIVSGTIDVGGGRKLGSLVLLQRDEGNYVEVTVDARRGRLVLGEVVNKRSVASVAAALTPGTHMLEAVAEAGRVTCRVDGVEVLSLPYAGLVRGALALRGTSASVELQNGAVSF